MTKKNKYEYLIKRIELYQKWTKGMKKAYEPFKPNLNIPDPIVVFGIVIAILLMIKVAIG